MIKHGEAPYLECSGAGDKRFSARYARIRQYGNLTIENLYQSSKMFLGKEGLPVRLNIWMAKGKMAINQPECAAFYKRLWEIYIVQENPELLKVLREATGLSDKFGQEGHCCQATELWRIRNGLHDGDA
jgi:hypothetical protein